MTRVPRSCKDLTVDAGRTLDLVHGDRVGRRWFCGPCDELVDELHDCYRERPHPTLSVLARHVERLERDLERLARRRPLGDARSPLRRNRWVESSLLYSVPPELDGFDVTDGPYRFATCAWWRRCERYAAFVLHAPAPREWERAKLELERCIELARGWELDGCVLVYLYAFEHDIDDHACLAREGVELLGRWADRAIALAASDAELVVAAWGGARRARVREVLAGALAGVELHALDAQPISPLARRRGMRYAAPRAWQPSDVIRSAA